MKAHIHNPYKVNWKMYGLIGVISILVMIFASFCCSNAQNVQSIIFDIIRNLSYGGVASVFIALLIEIGNVKEKNNKANNLYEMIYSDLKINILWYLNGWARFCNIVYKDKEYKDEKHTWTEWYGIVKNRFIELDDKRQEQVLEFFKDELIYNLDAIEKSIDYINKQQFILSINELYDENLKSIIENFKFECYGAKSFLKINFNSEKFWKSFDAINEDLKKYICSCIDIQYYNYYKFKPFDILTNKSDIRTAIIESKKHNKLK